MITVANVAQAGRQYDLSSRWVKRHHVRLTALLALREVLLEERYEECPEIIAVAKEFGASEWEIYYLLEDSRRRP